MKPIFNISEAAKILNVDESTLRRWDKDGILPCIRTGGGQRRYLREALERYLGHPIPDDPPENASMPIQMREDYISPVQQAKDELEILKIAKEKERILLADRQLAHETKLRKMRDNLFANLHPHACRLFRLEHVLHGIQIKPIPVAYQIKINSMVKALIDKVETLDIQNLELLKLELEEAVDSLRNKYSQEYSLPAWKAELINGALAMNFPSSVPVALRKRIIDEIRKELQASISGHEEPAEIYSLADSLKEEKIRDYEEIQRRLLRDTEDSE